MSPGGLHRVCCCSLPLIAVYTYNQSSSHGDVLLTTMQSVAADHPDTFQVVELNATIESYTLENYAVIFIPTQNHAWSSAQKTLLSNYVSGGPLRRVVLCHDGSTMQSFTNGIASGIGMTANIDSTTHTPSAGSAPGNTAVVNTYSYLAAGMISAYEAYASRINQASAFLLIESTVSGSLVPIAVHEDIEGSGGLYVGGSRVLIGDINYMMNYSQLSSYDPDENKNRRLWLNLCTAWRTPGAP